MADSIGPTEAVIGPTPAPTTYTQPIKYSTPNQALSAIMTAEPTVGSSYPSGAVGAWPINAAVTINPALLAAMTSGNAASAASSMSSLFSMPAGLSAAETLSMFSDPSKLVAKSLSGNLTTAIVDSISTTAPPAVDEAVGTTHSSLNTTSFTPTQTVINDQAPAYALRPNQLSQLSSYSYNISLIAMTPADYKMLIANPGLAFSTQNVLISSGGKRKTVVPGGSRKSDGDRNENFSDDFYIDKMSMETIIGTTPQSSNSNAIHVTFTVVEPYGMTLLSRLLNTAKQLGQANHSVMPYLLKIEFIGYDSDGLPTCLDDITKFVPIQIINMKTKLGTKGTEYEFEAAPVNHVAFLESAAAAPIKFEVTALTVGDFFLTNTNADQMNDDSASTIAGNTKFVADLKVLRDAQTLVATSGAPADVRILSQLTADQLGDVSKYVKESTPTSLRVKSFTNGINTWWKKHAQNKIVEYNDVYEFNIHPDIAKATLVRDKDLANANKAMGNPGENQTGLETNADSTNVVAINQGTSVLEVIGMALRASSYLRDQMIDPQSPEVTPATVAAWEKRVLTWFKVIPRVDIGQYDHIRNTYQRKFTYRIDPYVIYNSRNPYAPGAKPNGFSKEYNYIFTGKNTEVLNFDLTFDTLFYTSIPASTNNLETQTGAKDRSYTLDPTDKLENQAVLEGEVANTQDTKDNGELFLQPRRHIQSQQIGSLQMSQSAKDDIAKQVQQQTLLSSATEMIQVNLKVVGDPDFIKQDDIFFTADSVNLEDNTTPNGSIATDVGEVMVNLNFSTPDDYNDNGMAIPGTGKYSSATFSGIYLVLRVKSIFQNGKFEQELQLVRYGKQPTQGVVATTSYNSKEVDEQREGATGRPKILKTAPTVITTQRADSPQSVADETGAAPASTQPGGARSFGTPLTPDTTTPGVGILGGPLTA